MEGFVGENGDFWGEARGKGPVDQNGESMGINQKIGRKKVEMEKDRSTNQPKRPLGFFGGFLAFSVRWMGGGFEGGDHLGRWTPFGPHE